MCRETSEKGMHELARKIQRRLRRTCFDFIATCALLIIFLIQMSQAATVNRIIVHFNQCMAITSPYLDEEQEELLRSRFASMKTKDEHTQIMADLEAVATKNEITLPESP